MPKLLQINVTANWGSTGKIAEQIGQLAIEKGWKSYLAYGRNMNPSKSELIKVGSTYDVYQHYALNKLFDKEGLASSRATRRLVSYIKELNPDIIHLHNIHDHYLNYPILFDFLNKLETPIVWTQHDCWSYTGGCGYFSMKKCEKWKTECFDCPQRRGIFCDNSRMQYLLKKDIFTKVKNLTLVPVSDWLSQETKKSFLGSKRIYTILNGVDVNVFKPVGGIDVKTKYNLHSCTLLLGIASSWPERKGLKDYIKLSKILPKETKIVLIGLTGKQAKGLPSNIINIPRTQNVDELVAFYNSADIVLNLSYEETFGLTTAEGFACGTPSIVYNCTASPELITKETGRVVEPGDILALSRTITEMLNGAFKKTHTADCSKRAIECFDKNKCFEEYFELYEKLLNKTNNQ